MFFYGFLLKLKRTHKRKTNSVLSLQNDFKDFFPQKDVIKFSEV